MVTVQTSSIQLLILACPVLAESHALCNSLSCIYAEYASQSTIVLSTPLTGWDCLQRISAAMPLYQKTGQHYAYAHFPPCLPTVPVASILTLSCNTARTTVVGSSPGFFQTQRSAPPLATPGRDCKFCTPCRVIGSLLRGAIYTAMTAVTTTTSLFASIPFRLACTNMQRQVPGQAPIVFSQMST